MKPLGHYRSEVVRARSDATVRELVEPMALSAVGGVVIVDEAERPIGIVTDRDLTCRVIAEGRDPAATRAADIMSKPLVTVSPDDRLEQLVERMSSNGMRRLPVVQGERLVGIVSLDDVLIRVARELDDLGEASRREIEDARERARWTRRRAQAEEGLRDVLEQLQRAGEDSLGWLAREVEALRERLRGRD